MPDRTAALCSIVPRLAILVTPKEWGEHMRFPNTRVKTVLQRMDAAQIESGQLRGLILHLSAQELRGLGRAIVERLGSGGDTEYLRACLEIVRSSIWQLEHTRRLRLSQSADARERPQAADSKNMMAEKY